MFTNLTQNLLHFHTQMFAWGEEEEITKVFITDGRVAWNWVRLPLNGTSGFFKDQFSVHFGSMSQHILKMILKSLRYVPFRANLCQFGANSANITNLATMCNNRHVRFLLFHLFYKLQQQQRPPTSVDDLTKVLKWPILWGLIPYVYLVLTFYNHGTVLCLLFPVSEMPC